MNGTVRIWSIPLLILLACVSTASAGNVPDEALRHMARGEAAVEMARSPEDFARAIAEFQAATRIAPQWADPHYNLGLVQEKAGKYGDAARSLKKYLSLNPRAEDAATVKTRIYKLEYKAEQVITRDDALNIFASLSDRSKWDLRRIDGYDNSKYMALVRSLKREGDRIAITYVADILKKTLRTHHVRPTGDGKHLSFQLYFDNWYGDPRYRGAKGVLGCYEVEILSRQKVVVSDKECYPNLPVGRAATHVHRLEYVAR